MQLIRRLNHILKQASNKRQESVLTIGNFDGVHLGHAQIINKVTEIAREKNMLATILTFEPHPILLFKPDLARDFRLTSLAQKLKIFRDKKIDRTIIIPFNHDFAELSARDFIKMILVDALNVKYLVIGYDFIFGKNREGNLQLLEEESKRYGFNIINIAALKKDAEIYSSSLIRNYIKNGKIKETNQALGTNFAIEGIINNGKKLGRAIGFPTANIKAKPHIIKPKFGVYKVRVNIAGENYNAIMNFGLKPTVSSGLEPLYEVHIFDFNHDIYGQKIRVELIDFIREEKKFGSLIDLKQQIAVDVLQASTKNLDHPSLDAL